MFNFSLIIPAFNESKNIINLIDEINSNLNEKKYNFEIIVIDDASTDNTKDLLINKKLLLSNLKIITNQNNKGQSYSIKIGIQKSTFNNIVTLDGDGQNDPSDIPRLIELYESNKNIKLVAGIRKKRQDTKIKKISSLVANKIRKRVLNDGCDDTGCALKIFDKNIFLSFRFFNGIHRFLPALYNGFGYEISFVNVNHRHRKYGISKYGIVNRLFKGIYDMIKVYFIINKKL